jgi:hypothetical protein
VTDILFWLLPALPVGIAVSLILEDRKLLHKYRQESSRFKMFAARDALVALIAEGKMSESDDAWANAYGACNDLLHLDHRLDIWDLLYRHARHQAALEDHKNGRKVLLFRRALARAMQSCPEFGACVRDVDEALRYMVQRRTTRVGWVSLFAYILMKLLIDTIKANALSFDKIKSGWKAVKETIASPQAVGFAGTAAALLTHKP